MAGFCEYLERRDFISNSGCPAEHPEQRNSNLRRGYQLLIVAKRNPDYQLVMMLACKNFYSHRMIHIMRILYCQLTYLR